MQIQILRKDELSTLKELISGYTGFTFSDSREHTLRQALAAFCKDLNCTSLVQFEQMLRGDSELMRKFSESLLIHETYFFRERGSLEQLVSLLQNKCGDADADHPVRIWSAGCSTGEEPYSIALLLLEGSLKANFRIVATDISQQALNHANIAQYSDWSLRSLNEVQKEKYFEKGIKTFRLKDDNASKRVTFVKANLTADYQLSSEWSALDAIVCRNVLIYFEPQSIEKIARMFFDHLKPGGILLTGASDPPLAGAANFEIEYTRSGIVYRKPESNAYQIHSPKTQNATVENFAKSQATQSVSDRKPVTGPVAASRRSQSAPAASRKSLNSRSSAANRSIKSIREQAAKLYRDGQWQEVVNLLTPHKATAKSLLIRSLLNLGRIEEAMVITETACKDDPLDAANYILLALVMMSEQRHKEAASVLKKAIFLDRNFIVAHFLLGISSFCTGDRNQATKSMKNAQNLFNALPEKADIPLAEDESREQFGTNIQRYLSII